MHIKVLQKFDISLDVALGTVEVCSLSTRMSASFLGDNIEEESWLHVTPPAGEVRGRLLALHMLCKNVVEMVKCVSGRTVFT